MGVIMRTNRFALCLLGLVIASGMVWGTDISISNLLPTTEILPDSVTIQMSAGMAGEMYYLYYRTKGMKAFQVRKMNLSPNGGMMYRIPLTNLYGRELEYFILSSRGKKGQALSPVFSVKDLDTGESPRIYFQDIPDPSSPSALPREPLVRMNGSLSTITRIRDKSSSGAKAFSASGNLRLYRNIVKEKYQLDLDSNFVYLSQVQDTESHVNLSSMMVRLKTGEWKVEAGDLSLSNSEFSTSYLSRRGISAEMNGKWFSVGSFLTNSQQKTGFEGFGIPPSGAMLFGAHLGLHSNSRFKIRGLFLTGKDNVDSRTISSSEDVVREGQLMSLSGEMNLFRSRLQVTGEYAHSTFGKAGLEETLEKQEGTAWRADARYNAGILSVGGGYQKIDNYYNSIANLFLQNDREGWKSDVGLNIKSFSMSVNYSDQTTYMNSVIQPALHTKNLSSNFSWMIANLIRIGAEYGVDNLDYDQSTGLQYGGTDMETLRYAVTLGLIAGANGITLRVGKTESKTFTSNLDASLALNLRFGQFMTLNPTVSYQSTDNLSDGTNSKIYNLYLNSELTFIQQVLTLTLSGSYSRNDNGVSDSQMIQASGNINFYMAKIFKNKVQPTLVLVSRYQESQYGDMKDDNLAFYLQFNVSF